MNQEERELPETRIVVRPNGPYRVFGPIRLFDNDGHEFEVPEGDWYVLCRCGRSDTLPFCDSSHKKLEDWCPETYAPPRADPGAD